MNVFLDTNVLIDFLSKRNDYQDALRILRLSVLSDTKLFVSDLTIANCRYILRKDYSIDKFCDTILRLRNFIHIVPIGLMQLTEHWCCGQMILRMLCNISRLFSLELTALSLEMPRTSRSQR